MKEHRGWTNYEERLARGIADRLSVEEYLNNPRDTAPAELLTDICLPLA